MSSIWFRPLAPGLKKKKNIHAATSKEAMEGFVLMALREGTRQWMREADQLRLGLATRFTTAPSITCWCQVHQGSMVWATLPQITLAQGGFEDHHVGAVQLELPGRGKNGRREVTDGSKIGLQQSPATPAHFDVDLHSQLLSVAWKTLAKSVPSEEKAPRKQWMSGWA